MLPGNRRFACEGSASELRVVRQPSGHLVVYGPHGRRLLLTDPLGHPLHECEWSGSPTEPDNPVRLVAARLYLDWGQWVGIQPEGMIQTVTLDLSRRPGWEGITTDDLRRMAAKAMGFPLEAIEFFYGDQDFVVQPNGIAVIRHRKDAFYILEDGRFDRRVFMSCMAAMHWDCIDFLPVVELFKSLLPGTGSAAFELIRGLYDDQNPTDPRPLTYRGIPTYPSEAAFALFSAYFLPSVRGSESPFSVFMDPPRSHEVTWLPHPDPPRRYVDLEQRLCVTIKQGCVQKVTVMDDPAGLPFVQPGPSGFAAYGRAVLVENESLILQENGQRTRYSLRPLWQVDRAISSSIAVHLPNTWRAMFPYGPPSVSAREAFSAVLCYPEDDQEIGEHESQPFVADYLEDRFEQDERLVNHLHRTARVLIDRFDAALGPLFRLDRPRTHTVLFSAGALAQKHAQALWNLLAKTNRLTWTRFFQFFPAYEYDSSALFPPYDLVFTWIPFADYATAGVVERRLRDLTQVVTPGGLVFMTGPEMLSALVVTSPFSILDGQAVAQLPTFLMHRSILPQARLHQQLWIWQLERHSG
ncbi:MAG: hypothetical protein D6704_07385 [Nitrospirae bacterium]|nr:MAG: hypothetical protein D6704_07385 [Nitrospirota bacterium]